MNLVLMFLKKNDLNFFILFEQKIIEIDENINKKINLNRTPMGPNNVDFIDQIVFKNVLIEENNKLTLLLDCTNNYIKHKHEKEISKEKEKNKKENFYKNYICLERISYLKDIKILSSLYINNLTSLLNAKKEYKRITKFIEEENFNLEYTKKKQTKDYLKILI